MTGYGNRNHTQIQVCIFLNENIYHVLPLLLEDVTLVERRDLWCSHDPASAHFERESLNAYYGQQWKGRDPQSSGALFICSLGITSLQHTVY